MATFDDTSTRARVTIDVNASAVIHSALKIASERSEDARVRARSARALEACANSGGADVRVDYDVVFDAFACLRANGESEATVMGVIDPVRDIRFELTRRERTLTKEEENEREAHRALMDKLRDEVEARKYADITRDVDRGRASRSNAPSPSFKSDVHAYGLGAHVLTIMFACATAGYVGGRALEQGGFFVGVAWARGLCTALGAALGLFTEVGLLILRESRAMDTRA